MDRQQLTTTVTEVLEEIQGYSGHAPPPITPSTCPIGDLEGFDSINAVEAASMLSDRLGQTINPKVMLSNNPNEPLRVSDIVERIMTDNGTYSRRAT